ncbi:hypothetical protein C7M84_006380 [Penaeus vannamei]|uniref:Uncharacterized protein n=1 Tax=Penaeus vannamei TaxID=6689 RepID=A0A423TF27_PENVA|nr:hypothetical protein C7M84_006380 [Penaeus vannamei]
MSTPTASELPAHTGNGMNVDTTYKSCKRLVQKMNDTHADDAHRVWMRSTDQATTTPVKGRVEGKFLGEIPQWLEGSLYRDGPGVLNIGDTWYHHVFDGMAVLHKFSIKVRGFMSTFAGPDLDGMTDNCAVNVCFYGDQLFAMTETNKMRRVDPADLKTVGDKTNITNYVAVNMATAHPHVDPDGTVYNMGNSFMGAKGPTYNVIRFPPKKTLPSGKVLNSFEQATVVASIPCQWKMRPCYYHSFSITDNYFILVEQPLGVSVPKLLVNHYRGKSFMQAMDWIPDAKTKFRVVRRSDGRVLKADYQADTFFTFHAINAFEEDGHLVVDLCCFDDGAVVNQIWLENILEPTETFNKALQATPRRYVLPLNTEVNSVLQATPGKNLVTLQGTKCTASRDKNGAIYCQPEDLSPHCMEMPRINYRFNGKKYRYSYGFIPTKGLNCGTHYTSTTYPPPSLVLPSTLFRFKWQLPHFEVSIHLIE